jgi:hypothetical protein
LSVIARPKCGQHGRATKLARSSVRCQDRVDVDPADVRFPLYVVPTATLRCVTVQYDNPAGRLHRLLEALRVLQPPTMGIRDAWIAATKADVNRSMQLERRVLLVVQLPIKITSLMDSIPDDGSFDREFAMRWFPQVQTAFQNSFFNSGPIDNITGNYNEGTLASLESCSYTLHRFRSEATPTADEISEIQAQVNDLLDSLKSSSDLDPSLRSLLLVHSNAMARAIDDFLIAGSEAMRDQLDQTIGALMRTGYFPQVKAAGEAEEDSAVKKFWLFLGRIALIVSVSTGLLELGHQAYNELESHSGTPSITRVVELPAPQPPPEGSTADQA